MKKTSSGAALRDAPPLGACCHLQFVYMMHFAARNASFVKLAYFHLVKRYPKVELGQHHALYET